MDNEGPLCLERNRRPLLALIVGAISIAVFLPGRPAQENRLRWREPGPGLHFGSPSQALSERPITSLTGGLTFEIWLAPGFVPRAGNREIISFYDEHWLRPLVLGQFQYGYLLRGRADNPTGNPRLDRYIDLGEVDLQDEAELSHLAVSVGATGARLHVNGKATHLVLPKTIARPGEAFGGYLMLGSSGTGWSVWRDDILGIAIFDRELSQEALRLHASDAGLLLQPEFQKQKGLITLYTFSEGRGRRARNEVTDGPDLLFPKRITRTTRPNFLSTKQFHFGARPWLMLDMLLNILGFMPLGFVLCWRRSRRYWLLALASGFVFSLSIELLQTLIPGRSSSMLDLASNSVGAFAGGVIAWFASARRHASHHG